MAGSRFTLEQRNEYWKGADPKTSDPSSNEDLIPLGAGSYLDDDSNAKHDTSVGDGWFSSELVGQWRCDQSSDQGANRKLADIRRFSLDRFDPLALQALLWDRSEHC